MMEMMQGIRGTLKPFGTVYANEAKQEIKFLKYQKALTKNTYDYFGNMACITYKAIVKTEDLYRITEDNAIVNKWLDAMYNAQWEFAGYEAEVYDDLDILDEAIDNLENIVNLYTALADYE